MHRIGVHHPGHRLAVGVHIGRRNIGLRPNDDGDFGCEASCQALKLAERQLLRVNGDAALAAAVGKIHHGTLPRHPHGEGLHFVDVYILMEADAALRWAASKVVLYTVPLEDSSGAVIHAHREVHGELSARLAQHGGDAGVEAEPLCGKVKLLLRNCPSALLCTHRFVPLHCRPGGCLADAVRRSTQPYNAPKKGVARRLRRAPARAAEQVLATRRGSARRRDPSGRCVGQWPHPLERSLASRQQSRGTERRPHRGTPQCRATPNGAWSAPGLEMR